MLLAVQEPVLALPRHKLKGPPLWKPYVHSLKKLKLPRKVPLPLWLHGRLLFVAQKRELKRPVPRLDAKDPLVKKVRPAVKKLKQLHRPLKQRLK